VTFRQEDLEFLRRTVAGVRVLISTHVHPDPDAIGSVLAARDLLLQMGAQPQVILADPFPPRMQWLPGADSIVTLPSGDNGAPFSVAFIVDAANQSRIGDVEKLLLPGATVINCDHHISNDHFGALSFVDVAYAATAELLYDLCLALGLTLTVDIAANLYAGLLTDTGRFRYSNTSARALEVAAALVRAGANITEITNRLYYDISVQDVHSVGTIFSTLALYGDGKISMMFVRRENTVEDPDTVVDTGLSIRGVEISALLTEAPESKIRVSLRSRSFVNVSSIAERFGGGGHEKAAGFRMHGDLESVRQRILPALLEAVQVATPKPSNAEV
jgi:bifunctional oligoribonuclease and PAP phosphatase NrnA